MCVCVRERERELVCVKPSLHVSLEVENDTKTRRCLVCTSHHSSCELTQITGVEPPNMSSAGYFREEAHSGQRRYSSMALSAVIKVFSQ